MAQRHQVFMKLFCQNCIQSSPLSWPIQAETKKAIENSYNNVHYAKKKYLYLEELDHYLNNIIKPLENSNRSRLRNELLTDTDKCTITVSELTEMCEFYQMEEYQGKTKKELTELFVKKSNEDPTKTDIMKIALLAQDATQLKEIYKEFKISKYSNNTKCQLINKIMGERKKMQNMNENEKKIYQLEKESKNYLITKCKTLRVDGYSKLGKKELVKKIMEKEKSAEPQIEEKYEEKSEIEEKYDDDKLNALTVNKLKKECNELGIKNYSSLRKSDLIDTIIEFTSNGSTVKTQNDNKYNPKSKMYGKLKGEVMQKGKKQCGHLICYSKILCQNCGENIARDFNPIVWKCPNVNCQKKLHSACGSSDCIRVH